MKDRKAELVSQRLYEEFGDPRVVASLSDQELVAAQKRVMAQGELEDVFVSSDPRSKAGYAALRELEARTR